MGKGTNGMSSPETLEQEVREIRDEMTPVLEELDHRRHAMTDRTQQLTQRAPAVLRGLVIALAVYAGLKFLRQRRARSRRRRMGFESLGA